MLIKKVILFSVFIYFNLLIGQPIPKIPIGMNIGSNNYYSECLVFNDVMKTASPWISFNAEGESEWNTGLADQIPLDSAGYPLEIPYTPAGEAPQKLRTLINNNYPGDYILLFDGAGQITINNEAHEQLGPNKYRIELTGYTENIWIDIDQSTEGNHIRNMRIIPEEYDGHEEEMPKFYAKFLQGLTPFHALRFMDWHNTNNSEQEEWADRTMPYYYSQGLSTGMSYEDAIELCNTLQTDAWFCVPHQADDDYHTRFTELVRDNLNPELKVYIEYSNEIWNWGFDQSHYVGENAPGHNNQYVIDDLTSINPTEYQHPEKDAYMMQRTFRLWSDVFTGAHSGRLIRVAAGQHSWMDNTRRILEYLFKKDMEGNPHTDPIYSASTGAGCDAFAVGGYFNFEERHHLEWNSMDPADVTPEMIIDTVMAIYDERSGYWSDVTAGFVNAFDVDYLVYEGGQHMQPYLQGEYEYNQSVWDAQIHPKMYDLYMKNFRKHAESEVDCKLFMAFSYVSERESRYGSWGHLESLEQVGAGNYMEIAPKYQALLDVNTTSSGITVKSAGQPAYFVLEQNYPNPFNNITMISYQLLKTDNVDLIIYNVLGEKITTLVSGRQSQGVYQIKWNAEGLSSGMYLCILKSGNTKQVKKMMYIR
ncbi:MAG: T9SS type A sorting domain-containing protein [Calditrichaceae bacterium]|nr:T9SS type A sorting domain-containing protein [Calditrichaceae bacterium]RQV95146.1 MAG: T9SS C-terminal target domain-containing protein [Calditrichota bacterium]